jgi:hypothetical protein
MKYRY